MVWLLLALSIVKWPILADSQISKSMAYNQKCYLGGNPCPIEKMEDSFRKWCAIVTTIKTMKGYEWGFQFKGSRLFHFCYPMSCDCEISLKISIWPDIESEWDSTNGLLDYRCHFQPALNMLGQDLEYLKILLQDVEIVPPCFNNKLTQLGTVWNHWILQVIS